MKLYVRFDIDDLTDFDKLKLSEFTQIRQQKLHKIAFALTAVLIILLMNSSINIFKRFFKFTSRNTKKPLCLILLKILNKTAFKTLYTNLHMKKAYLRLFFSNMPLNSEILKNRGFESFLLGSFIHGF